jgi:hypothetical protein
VELMNTEEHPFVRIAQLRVQYWTHKQAIIELPKQPEMLI